MTKINVPYRIFAEQLKSLDDDTKNSLVLPLNQFNEQVNGAFNKGISINDNMTSQIMAQVFTSGIMLVLKNPLPVVPIGVSAISGGGPDQYVENIFLTPQSNQAQIGVTVNWQPNSYIGNCTFILFGG
jgi:hypothetical protein